MTEEQRPLSEREAPQLLRHQALQALGFVPVPREPGRQPLVPAPSPVSRRSAAPAGERHGG